MSLVLWSDGRCPCTLPVRDRTRHVPDQAWVLRLGLTAMRRSSLPVRCPQRCQPFAPAVCGVALWHDFCVRIQRAARPSLLWNAGV